MIIPYHWTTLTQFQEFISTACIEHLDFLQIDTDLENMFSAFTEKDMGKQFKSLTNIPRASVAEEPETWVDFQVNGLICCQNTVNLQFFAVVLCFVIFANLAVFHENKN